MVHLVLNQIRCIFSIYFKRTFFLLPLELDDEPLGPDPPLGPEAPLGSDDSSIGPDGSTLDPPDGLLDPDVAPLGPGRIKLNHSPTKNKK